ncbi:MAG: VWA domain-containing protein [Nannocystaceae bacterium]|nr:VWA domain-containing protein [Nannocystaceae bacterium]
MLAATLACACQDNRDEPATATTLTTASGDDDGDTTATASTGMLAVPDIGGGATATEGDVDGTDDCAQDIDIVFVMDVSTSMGPVLSKLGDEILVVDEAIAALGLPNPPHYGLVVFVDDAVILGSGGPYPDVASLQQDFVEWAGFTSSNQQVGGGNLNTTWPENSLDALFLGAAAFQWRPAGDATLRMIIHTTDDTFWDGPTTGNGVAIAHGYDEVVTALQDRSIRTFSFAAQIGGECECEDVTPGWSTPYQGKTPLPEATDGAVFDIDLVFAGQLSLSAAIAGAIDDTMCQPYTPVG